MTVKRKGNNAIVWISNKASELQKKDKSLSRQDAVKKASALYRAKK